MCLAFLKHFLKKSLFTHGRAFWRRTPGRDRELLAGFHDCHCRLSVSGFPFLHLAEEIVGVDLQVASSLILFSHLTTYHYEEAGQFSGILTPFPTPTKIVLP